MSNLISSIRVEVLGGHVKLSVWTRGALSGDLFVALRDAHAIINRLDPGIIFPCCPCERCMADAVSAAGAALREP